MSEGSRFRPPWVIIVNVSAIMLIAFIVLLQRESQLAQDTTCSAANVTQQSVTSAAPATSSVTQASVSQGKSTFENTCVRVS